MVQLSFVFQIYNKPVGEPSPIPSQSSTVLKVPVMRVVQVAWGALASRGEERTVVAAAHQRKRVAMVREANMLEVRVEVIRVSW
jgi:hypothetical protein